MFIEICLAIIAAALVVLVIALIRISSKAQRSVQLVQSDIHELSKEAMDLLHNVNNFVRSDLHQISYEASHFVGKLSDISSNIRNKTESLGKGEAIPQAMKWIASGLVLVKTIKELMKNHEK